MNYEKTIVCLANSRKKSGRCIAGKEIIHNQSGQWIRPVSNRQTEEISEEERMFENGDYPQLLDIISIRFIQHKPHNLQPENHLIDSKSHWKKISKSNYNSLNFMTDKPLKLWINGLHSSNGHNDRFKVTNGPPLHSSLYLIYLEKLKIEILSSSYGKRKARAIFHFNKDKYNLAITDPRVEHYFLKKENGIYNVNNVYLCISIGLEFEEYYYKLVASIIKDPPF